MPNVPSSDKTTDHENKTMANKNRQKKKTKASSTDLQPQQQKTSSADRKTQEEKKNKGKRRLERRYGRFHCKNCNRGWESSHVYVVAGTLKVVYKQQCKKCRLPWFPYANEEYEKSDYTRPRHVDVKKPHPADLCGKCLAGYRCN